MIRSLLNTTLVAASLGLFASAHSAAAASAQLVRFPADRSKSVNPDTHLVLTFPETPTLGAAGQIRIYDVVNDGLVDVLDLSIPPGPTTRADAAAQAAPCTPTPYVYVSGPRATTRTRNRARRRAQFNSAKASGSLANRPLTPRVSGGR